MSGSRSVEGELEKLYSLEQVTGGKSERKGKFTYSIEIGSVTGMLSFHFGIID